MFVWPTIASTRHVGESCFVAGLLNRKFNSVSALPRVIDLSCDVLSHSPAHVQ